MRLPDIESGELTSRMYIAFQRNLRRFRDPAVDDYLRQPYSEACYVAMQAAAASGWFMDLKKGEELYESPETVGELSVDTMLRVGGDVMALYVEAGKIAVVSPN